MKKTTLTLSAVLCVTLLAGCLVSETTHTVYIAADGSLEWIVLEQEIHSIHDDREERGEQEREYLAAARLGRHDLGEALGALRPLELEWKLLRDRRPYSVLTRASFTSLEWMLVDLLDAIGLPGSVAVRSEGRSTEVAVTVFPDQAWESDSPASHLLDAWLVARDRYRIVLEEGTFTAAAGFEILEHETVAVPAALPDDFELPEGPLTLSLAWEL